MQRMEFRPCIDIHNGAVKQIVGSSLSDLRNGAVENYVSCYDAPYYAELYQKLQLTNGHIILLNPVGSPYYEATKKQALDALAVYPQGMQIGGGIHDQNAKEYLDAGASHVIVTSYVFQDGIIHSERLEKLTKTIGKNRIVLDLSCRKKDGKYYIMTNRWQTYTKEVLTYDLLDQLSERCDEFLIHAVDVEGKSEGIEEELVQYLGKWNGVPITYAGGVHSLADITKLREYGNEKIHVTVGSALELFGGSLSLEAVMEAVYGTSAN